jgi:hypothetical protein
MHVCKCSDDLLLTTCAACQHLLTALATAVQLLLQVEFSSAAVHLLALVHPLVLSKLSVECALLQPAQLQCKARSKLLQPGPCRSAFFSLDCSSLASHTSLYCFFIHLFIVVVRIIAASVGTVASSSARCGVVECVSGVSCELAQLVDESGKYAAALLIHTHAVKA